MTWITLPPRSRYPSRCEPHQIPEAAEAIYRSRIQNTPEKKTKPVPYHASKKLESGGFRNTSLPLVEFPLAVTIQLRIAPIPLTLNVHQSRLFQSPALHAPIDQDRQKLPDIKLRPQAVDKHDLGILMALPQHKVAKPAHATCAHEEVKRRATSGEEMIFECLLRDGLEIGEASCGRLLRRRGGVAEARGAGGCRVRGCAESYYVPDRRSDFVAGGVGEADIEDRAMSMSACTLSYASPEKRAIPVVVFRQLHCLVDNLQYVRAHQSALSEDP